MSFLKDKKNKKKKHKLSPEFMCILWYYASNELCRSNQVGFYSSSTLIIPEGHKKRDLPSLAFFVDFPDGVFLHAVLF